MDYIDTRSFCRNIVIILKTVGVVLKKVGSKQGGSSIMPSRILKIKDLNKIQNILNRKVCIDGKAAIDREEALKYGFKYWRI